MGGWGGLGLELEVVGGGWLEIGLGLEVGGCFQGLANDRFRVVFRAEQDSKAAKAQFHA